MSSPLPSSSLWQTKILILMRIREGSYLLTPARADKNNWKTFLILLSIGKGSYLLPPARAYQKELCPMMSETSFMAERYFIILLQKQLWSASHDVHWILPWISEPGVTQIFFLSKTDPNVQNMGGLSWKIILIFESLAYGKATLKKGLSLIHISEPTRPY